MPEAMSYYEEAYKARVSALGEGDEETIASRKRMNRVRKVLGLDLVAGPGQATSGKGGKDVDPQLAPSANNNNNLSGKVKASGADSSSAASGSSTAPSASRTPFSPSLSSEVESSSKNPAAGLAEMAGSIQ